MVGGFETGVQERPDSGGDTLVRGGQASVHGG